MSDPRCDQCGKQPGTVRYTQVDSGQIHKGRLCAACARARGLLEVPAITTPTIQEALASAGPKAGKSATVPPLVCSSCGLTFSEFQSQGRLGCAACYTAFAAELQPLLRQIHGHSEHTGRALAAQPPAAARQQLGALRAALETAVQHEEYERAAELRDAIRALEQAPEGPPPAAERPAGEPPKE